MRYEDLPIVGQGGVIRFSNWDGTVGPHAFTVRLTISSATDEILVVRRICLFLYRVTSPSTYSIAYIDCYIHHSTGDHRIATLPLVQNEVTPFRFLVDYPNFPLVSGTSLNVATYDGSTGGTIRYRGDVFVERFTT
jgi:hypothetical protein